MKHFLMKLSQQLKAPNILITNILDLFLMTIVFDSMIWTRDVNEDVRNHKAGPHTVRLTH